MVSSLVSSKSSPMADRATFSLKGANSKKGSRHREPFGDTRFNSFFMVHRDPGGVGPISDPSLCHLFLALEDPKSLDGLLVV